MTTISTRLSLPAGARVLMPAESSRRRSLESRIVAELERGNYSEIILPVLDFVDPYRDVIPDDRSRQSYRFMDRNGDLVGIRSDFTPLAARALSRSLTASDLPLRIFYRGDVIRTDRNRLGPNRELFQIGSELLGVPGPEGDVEILSMAAAAVGATGMRPIIAVSDVSIVSEMMGMLEPSTGRLVRDALAEKRFDSVQALQRKEGSAQLDDLIELLLAADPVLELGRFVDHPVLGGSARRILAVTEAVAGLPADAALQLDAGVAPHSYYTGLQFQIISPVTRQLIGSGGRYDDLYSRFGFGCAAVGFTLNVDDLEELV